MITPTTIILAVLPIYLLIAGGAIIRKLGIIDEQHDHGIMKLVFNVMLPCFILDRMLGAPILRDLPTVGMGIGLGFGFIAFGIAAAYFGGRLCGLGRGNGLRTFALTTGCQNYGFTAIPVVEILWGSSAVALLFVHNIGVEVAIWSVGIMLLSGEKRISWKRLINGPIIAVVMGLFLVLTHLDQFVVGPFRSAISMIGIGAFPVAIFMTGAAMISLVGEEKFSKRTAAAAVFLRMMIIPAAMLLAARWIPMATELKQIILVQAAMPAAMTPILLARVYGGRPAMAVQIVIVTTLVSIFTLPYIIAFGIGFLNLQPAAGL